MTMEEFVRKYASVYPQEVWQRLQKDKQAYSQIEAALRAGNEVGALAVLNQIVTGVTGEITTDPVTGSQTQTRGEKTYIRESLGKDKAGAWTYPSDGWKLSTKAPVWRVTEWVQVDGSTSLKPTSETIGYIDQYGVPQQLDKAFQPVAPEEPTRFSDDENFYWNTTRGWMPTTKGQMAIAERKDWEASAAAAQAAADKRASDEADRAMRYALENEEIMRRYQQGQAYGVGVLEGAKSAGGEVFGRLPSPQATPITATGGPGNWINYWKQQQANIDPRTGTAWQTPAAYAARVGEWLPPDQLAKLQAATNVNPERQQVWDPQLQNYRPENESEYNFRTRTAPIRDIAFGYQQGADYGVGEGGEPLQPNWLTARENQLAEAALGNPLSQVYQARQQTGFVSNDRSAWEALTPIQREAIGNAATEENALRVAEWRRTNPQYYGPVTPEWAKGVLMPVSQSRVDLRTLGTPGNVVRPVSATTYQGWAPSQREGYGGLAAAQKGVYMPDYYENLRRMWTASTPGQMAQRRVRTYAR